LTGVGELNSSDFNPAIKDDAIFAGRARPDRGEGETMAEQQIRFEDGATYERMMGVWSYIAGGVFLDWLAPRPGLRWADIGCGSGAFSELLAERCAPAVVQGVDPSEAQLAFARTRPAARLAQFRQGNAMALPFPADSFDAAVMALVIFFVPEPAKGVAEMVRVVAPGGIIAAYAWDMLGAGYPGEAIRAELRALGLNPPLPPSVSASRIEALRGLWTEAGLDAIETREIKVQRSFADFDEFWAITLSAATIGPMVAAMPTAEVERLKARVRERLPADAEGRVTYTARANAIKGRKPE
jgi:ubiquinone/menaquinone biosynthesis C-methylase UbiE